MEGWWSSDIGNLLTTNAEAVAQRLALRLVETHHLNRETQVRAWREQVHLLQTALRTFPAYWRIILEYPLLRLGRRIDAVLLSENAIIVLEFKVGATSVSNLDRQQTEDYALDLFDFHSESRSHPIVPVLVATNARVTTVDWPLLWHKVAPVFSASADTFATTCERSFLACRHH